MANNNYALNLPPGFRFHPSDEDLVVHFLHRKAALLPCHPDVIPDLDLYPHDPWDLDGKAMVEGSMWYFYSRKTDIRRTVNGYWKASGVDEPIFTSTVNQKVGMKKDYVFYLGEPPEDGHRTNWMMQEYRLTENIGSSKRRGHLKKDYSKWVVCRVYAQDDEDEDNGTELSCMDEVFLSLDDLDEISFPHYLSK